MRLSKKGVIPSRCFTSRAKSRLRRLRSKRACGRSGVGIPWFLEHFLSKTEAFSFYLGDCHTR